MFLSSLGILSVDSIPSARTNLFNDLPRKSPHGRTHFRLGESFLSKEKAGAVPSCSGQCCL